MKAADGCVRQVEECRDMLTDESPAGLRLRRLTNDSMWAHSHIYMESPVFTPDGDRFVYQRMEAAPRDIYMAHRWRQFWLCDLADGCSLRPLTDPDEHATAPAVSPDGQYFYYVVNTYDPRSREGLRINRLCLRSFRRETVVVLDRPLSGTSVPPCRAYPLASIRSDGGELSLGAFLGDGVTEGAPWGVLAVDLATGETTIVAAGQDYLNPHQQYSRGSSPEQLHDVLIQKNIAVKTDAMGKMQSCASGCTLEVIRDDGRERRIIPCGTDRHELCHGHQEWRGAMASVLVGVDVWDEAGVQSRPVLEATPIPAAVADEQIPRLSANAASHRRNLTAHLPLPLFGHTATDLSGNRFAGDWRAVDGTGVTRMYSGILPATDDGQLASRYLFDVRSSYTRDQATHPHPCLSPDGERLLFNSDHGSGTPQIWLADNLTYPAI